MAHQALYRKYRSKSLDDIVGQTHATDTLKKALESGQVGHAYLFTGPRGVGKTSVARILAHEILGLTYDPLNPEHLDIIEMDAASNRRIDEMRELLDKVYVGPSIADKKIYIIDEVHMLTKEAFNALLKTLEEPPSHVVFIMATTELHKLPETIVSRTQRFGFRPIQVEAMQNHLRVIADKESINIEDEALELIAVHSDGGLRDAVSLLEQTMHHTTGQVTPAHVQSILGLSDSAVLEQITATISSGSASDLLVLLDSIYQQGIAPAQLAKQLARYWRMQMKSKQSELGDKVLLSGVELLLRANYSFDAGLQFESALLQTRQIAQPESLDSISQSTSKAVKSTKPLEEKTEEQVSPELTLAKDPKPAIEKVEVNEPAKETLEEKQQPEKDSGNSSFEKVEANTDGWKNLLLQIKKADYGLYASLRMSDADVEKQTLHLYFKFPFHKKRVDSTKTRKLLTNAIRQGFGEDYSVETHVSAERHEKKSTEQINKINDVLGGEVIQL